MTAPLSDTPMTLTGPWRTPAQMLQDQHYDGHKSVHDEENAARLGLAGAPIEGPTHFSQLEPLCAAVWGDRWFEQGCISSHFRTMVVEGEEVQASITIDGPGAEWARMDAVKRDGTPVLTGTVSVGDSVEPELEPRVRQAAANPPARLYIVDQMQVGQRGPAGERSRMGFDDHMGSLYPFTLREKLGKITESITYQQPGTATPWGSEIVPFEMISVITNSSSKGTGFVKARQPSLGLFIDLQVRMVNGPVLVGREYVVERELVALGESRRTESFWTRTRLVDDGVTVAEVLLHQGVFKDSYDGYPTNA